jgi:hemerythrin-like domain-containing protein
MECAMTSPVPETATSRLREEHQLILKVADAMQALLAEAEGPNGLDFDTIGDCVTFIRLFADACHHGKEEDLLFPVLEAAGMPRHQGPIAVMLHEHEQGRAFARQMADSLKSARDGDEQALGALKSAARGYVDLIRGHILKEDRILFEMADQAVRGSACESLCGGYGAVCARRFEGHSKEELQSLAARISERAGLV